MRVDGQEIDLVFSGSGTLAPCHVGAWAYLDERVKVARVAGTSGGAIVAAAIAFGWSPAQGLRLSKKFLAGGLLDPSPWFFNRYGVNKWDRMRKLFADHIPQTMGEAKIPLTIFVVDIETQQRVAISSLTHPGVFVADALAASTAIPGFVKTQTIRGMVGTFVDGGTSTNFAMGIFDDAPERRTVGVRLVTTPKRRKIKTAKDWLFALVGSMHDASNHSFVSRKRWADVVEVNSKGDGMDFTLGDDEVQALYNEGFFSAQWWNEH